MADAQAAFLEELAEMFEVAPEAVTPEFALTEDNWDSMAVVGAIAAIDECFGVTVDGDALRECQSVGDVLALVQGKTG